MEWNSSRHGGLSGKERNVCKEVHQKERNKLSISFLTCVLRRLAKTERMAIGEIFLSAFLQALFQSLVSPLIDDFFKGLKQKEKILERLQIALLTISAVLIDAEEMQITNKAVQDWVNKLKDIVYQAEDVVDDITIEDLLPKSDKATLTSNLTNVTKTLEMLAFQINTLSLKEVTTTTYMARLETTSLIGEVGVIGRETEKEKIMGCLMEDNEDDMKKSVVAIIGIGGVGKTTVAQLLYNEQRTEFFFEVKAWIHVSVEVDVFSLTKSIYQSVSSDTCAFTDLNLLQVKLKERLVDKKFLLVLDDMWSGTCEEWNLLCQPFASAGKGSRIIVTTRSHSVATIVRASHKYTLQPLSFEECWQLFIEHVCDDVQEQDLNQELGNLAENLVAKCQGLPLAAIAFGSMIQSDRKAANWMTILNSKIWSPPTNIFPALRVRYHYLPPPLKRCFAYCSIFPKGYAFDRKRVVLLWMAEGLLQQGGNTKRMEDVGDGYFTELVSRSLFQQKSGTKFTMHDLINELAQFAAGEFSFKYENPIQELSGKTRHLSYLRGQYSGEAMKFEELGTAKFLRTFLPLSLKDSSQTCNLNNVVTDKILPKLDCFRVLSLSDYNISKLPRDIFKRMRHVRYLDLSRTNLEKLPPSVRHLCNLQTLLLAYCPNLTELEEAICNLIRLEYLYLTATKLRHMPQNFGRLNRLRTLTTFVVGAGKGRGKGAAISALKDLIELCGKLTILELHRVGNIKDAEEANLASKTHLKEIDFTWRTLASIPRTCNDDAILEKLRPHTEIEELTIKRYYGNSFPAWMRDPSFSSIVCLTLIECQKCEKLPSLGKLPAIKELYISKMKDLTIIGPEFYTSNPKSQDRDQLPFRSLEILSFEDMPSWEEWEDVEVYGGTLFPNLQELFIVKCPELNSDLPGRFPSLTSCQIHQSNWFENYIDPNKYPMLQRQQ